MFSPLVHRVRDNELSLQTRRCYDQRATQQQWLAQQQDICIRVDGCTTAQWTESSRLYTGTAELRQNSAVISSHRI